MQRYAGEGSWNAAPGENEEGLPDILLTWRARMTRAALCRC